MIRQAVTDDAEELALLIKQVEMESPYMLYGAGEREISAQKQSDIIQALSESDNSAIFLAVKDGQLAGYLFAIGGNTKKNEHSAYIVIGLRKENQGRGIGTALFGELDSWAFKHKLHRLELTVIKENLSAVKLYEKTGFSLEGIKKDSLYMDGRFVDEYYMSKILEG
ncbi:GNAT family N-acetyltransferase [Oceanobacillus massiliensis]|uniref:GNAT family N-acetyltransferase n=1 Tax=Oceanobacillus massiliensis TaxID=1465765 RepID=UPI000288EA7F|nr:GNAT family N-acetyltransferase [Oceanobacillus massiliensis]